MKIVKYNDSMAPQVAEMWNKSQENWGNENTIMTPEQVIATEKTSGNINLYLAVDNDEVVGYCSISQYKFDEGASYLPLLNVRPDYHGKKVGKALILTVVKEAMTLNWPRFDLFTWSGNIKAMPLYKKCGFFWERHHSNVHLMNFIPYLYQSEALSDYLSQIDWYKDSVREIKQEHDGDTRNEMDYFGYHFKNDKTELKFEFERFSRGLTQIDTPDYTIQLRVDSLTQIYENKYPVYLDVTNKTEKPLQIDVKGSKHICIYTTFTVSELVTDRATLQGVYYVEKYDKSISKMKTYPSVVLEVLVNNKPVTMKIAVEPKPAVKLKLHMTRYNHKINKEYKTYVDIENNLTQKETFTVSLPSTFVEFKEAKVITLEPKQKSTLEFEYKLTDFGVYKEHAVVSYQDKTITKEVSNVFKGSMSSFVSQIEEFTTIYSGNYFMNFNSDGNNYVLMDGFDQNPRTRFWPPQLGKPFNLEFSNAKPNIVIVNDNEISVTYQSETFKDVEVTIHIKHYFGIMTAYYEVTNKGPRRTMSLDIPVSQSFGHLVIPFQNELLKIKDNSAYIGSIDATKIDENWFYDEKSKVGFTWDESLKMESNDWKMSFVIEDKDLNTNESFKTGTFTCSFNHKTLKDFRTFCGYDETRKTFDLTEFDVNNGNPFVTDLTEITFVNRKKADSKGTLNVDGTVADIKDSIHVSPGLHNITLETEENTYQTTRQTYKTNKSEIATTKEDSIYSVSNEHVTFKADKKYADSVYSLSFNNINYLDSNYPTPKEKAWWADFIGGITTRIQGLQDVSTLNELRNTEFITLQDNFNNSWTGIKNTLIVEQDPELKGLTIDTYTLTMPNVPGVYVFSNITNKTGKLMYRRNFFRTYSLEISDKKDTVLAHTKNKIFKCNNLGIDYGTKKLVTYTSDREYHMSFIGNEEYYLDTQVAYNILFTEAQLTIPHNTCKQLKGDFIFFSKEQPKDESFKDFKNIKFEV